MSPQAPVNLITTLNTEAFRRIGIAAIVAAHRLGFLANQETRRQRETRMLTEYDRRRRARKRRRR